MKQNIPCELIRDLLPLYVDGLTSEASNREIKEHLETCGSCRERYERMKRELEGEGIAALADAGDRLSEEGEKARPAENASDGGGYTGRGGSGNFCKIVCNWISGGFLPDYLHGCV